MKVLVVGFFGEGNLGDEAILQGLTASLGRDSRVVVTAGNHLLSVRGFRRVPRRGIASWLPFLACLKECRHVIFAGGIFQDWTVEGVTFYALRLVAASVSGAVPSLWGAGLGPLRNSLARNISGRALRHTGDCWMRDAGSVNLFSLLTGRTANLGTDWSWAIPYVPGKKAAGHLTAVNIRPWFDEKFRRFAIGRFQQIRLLPDSAIGVAARREDEILLLRTFPGFPVRTPGTFADLMKLGESLTAGYPMRYHVLLAWLRAGVPVVPLCYDDKVRALCQEAGIPTDMGADAFPVVAAPEFCRQSETRFAEMKAALDTLK